MKLTKIFLGLSFLCTVPLLGLTACTPDHHYSQANAIGGSGYPVDDRDRIYSNYKPLNGMSVGDTSDTGGGTPDNTNGIK